MKPTLTYLLFLICLTVQAQSDEFSKMDFLIGDWMYEAKSLTPDGSFVEQKFFTKCSYIFNEGAHKDDFYYTDPNGNLICYGTTIRTYDNQTQQWRMMWVESNLAISTSMTGEYRDGNFYFNGKGKDQRGEYLERITFYDISDDQYKWKMDRSYDGGKTWMKNYFSYTATKDR